MRFLLLATLSLLSLNGCGKFLDNFDRVGTTQVNINTGRNEYGRFVPLTCGSPCLPGGVVVIATDTGGNRFVTTGTNENSVLTLALPAGGTYGFVAYGWDSSGMTGTPRCGYGSSAAGGTASAIPIGGATADIYITMGQATCNDATFAATGLHFAAYGPVPLTLNFCNHGADLNPATYSSAPSSCSTSQSNYFTWGTTGSTIGDGGYMSALNTVILAVKGLSVPTLLATDLSAGTQSKPVNFTASQHFGHVKVAPALPGEGTKRFAFIANLNNADVEDLFLCTPSSCTATNNLTTLTHDASSCTTGTASVTSAASTISFAGCTATAGQLIIDPTGTIPPDTYVNGTLNGMVDANGTAVNATGSNGSLPIVLTMAKSVREFRFSPDGKFVVYVVATPGVTPKYELHSIDISGATPGLDRTLNGTIAGSSHGVGYCLGATGGSCNNQDRRFSFQVSPSPATYTGLSQPYVLYSSDESSTAGVYDLHFATLDGSLLYTSGAANGRIPTSLSATGDYAAEITFTGDAAYALVHTHSATPGHQYYRVGVTGTAAPSTAIICGGGSSGIATCNANGPSFAVGNAPTATHAYAAFQTYNTGSPNIPVLNVVDLVATVSSGTNPLQNVLGPTTSTNDEVQFREFQFSPDDAWLVALSKNSTGFNSCVRSAQPTVASASIVYNSCVSVVSNDQVASSKPNGGDFLRVVKDTAGNYSVMFLDKRTTNPDYDLKYAELVASGPVMHTISQSALGAGQGVKAFGYGSDGNAYFAVDYPSAIYELYKGTLAASPTQTQLGSTGTMGTISNLSDDTKKDREGGGGISGVLYLEGAPLIGAGSTESFLFNLSAGTFRRISKLNGLGRAQIVIPGAGGIGTSQCLVPGAPGANLNVPLTQFLNTNGSLGTAAVKIPFGDGSATSPMAVTIKVYANADSCSGSPTAVYSFPHGLARYLTAASPAAINLVTDGTPNNAMLYLDDQ